MASPNRPVSCTTEATGGALEELPECLEGVRKGARQAGVRHSGAGLGCRFRQHLSLSITAGALGERG